MDSSWHIRWGKSSFIMDPWLVGSEIDGFSWLNEQWHTTEPVSISDIPKSEFILITQSYQDHCHPETIELLDDQLPILATGKAFQLLKKSFSGRFISEISSLESKKPTSINGLNIFSIKPNRNIDPVYYSVLVVDEDHNALFVSPHGFDLSEAEIEILSDFNIRILMTTMVEFQIPKIMGGKVNPGLENAETLAQQLSPDYILNTHDEDKKMKGLISKLAKVKRPDFSSLKKEGFNFLESPDYKILEFQF